MPRILLILLGTQVIYSITDFMGRYYMVKYGFRLASFFSAWFAVYFAVRMVATFGQLYVFAHIPLGKTMALLAASSIIISNILGFLFLKEVLTGPAYAGVFLAVTAMLVMAFR